MTLQLGTDEHPVSVVYIFMAVTLPELPLHVHVVLEGEVGPWPLGRRQAEFLFQRTFDVLFSSQRQRFQ